MEEVPDTEYKFIVINQRVNELEERLQKRVTDLEDRIAKFEVENQVSQDSDSKRNRKRDSKKKTKNKFDMEEEEKDTGLKRQNTGNAGFVSYVKAKELEIIPPLK